MVLHGKSQIIGSELYWSVSGKVPKRTEILSMKSNGKCRIK